jgi:FixJ family two-component response regulator
LRIKRKLRNSTERRLKLAAKHRLIICIKSYAGAVDYLLKPFNNEDLLDAIDEALKSKVDGKK